jgi:uncharacterized protein (TIGR02001 family)
MYNVLFMMVFTDLARFLLKVAVSGNLWFFALNKYNSLQTARDFRSSEMKMKKLALACSVAMIAASTQTLAETEVSMNVGATSNYIWRGMTQTSDGAAVSGGLDAGFDSGIYLGTWASNVTDGFELDFYGGFAGEAGDFGYDLGAIYYMYKDDADADFAEVYANASFMFVNAGLAYTVSADNDPSEGDLYYFVGASFDLPQDFSIGGTIGVYDYDAAGSDDLTHYQIDLSKSAGDYGDVTFTLSDTDATAGADKDMRALVSWSKSF